MEVVKFARWLDVGLSLVDLRCSEEYQRRRLLLSPSSIARVHIGDTTGTFGVSPNSSVVVHLPLDSLLSGERSCELPPRHVPFAILVGSGEDDEERARELFFATTSRRTGKSRKVWNVRQMLLDDSALWEEAHRRNLVAVEADDEHRLDNDEDEQRRTPVRPRPRLWEPDPIVRTGVLPFLFDVIDRAMRDNNTKNDNASSFLVWDLGSGAGRDVCFLAEESLSYYHNQRRPEFTISCADEQQTRFPLTFVGADHHKGSADRCVPLWTRRGVGDITQAKRINLDKIGSLHDELMRYQRYNTDTISTKIVCCYAVRYLNRNLLKYLASAQSDNYDDCAAVKTTTATATKSNRSIDNLLLPPLQLNEEFLFATSHFCKPHLGAEWNFDHPKIKNVLERDELENLFTIERGWTVLKNELCEDGDHGRTLIQFIAKRSS